MIDRWFFFIINSNDTKPCPKAIKHGQAMEPAAKQHYIRMMKGNHTNFHAQDCGIFIHPQRSYIGASPDMLISCSCCGDGLLEVKCPIIAPCNVCLPNICKCKGKCLKYLQYVDGCASLKKKNPLHITHKFRAKWLLQTEVTVTFLSTQVMQLFAKGYVLILSIGKMLFQT